MSRKSKLVLAREALVKERAEELRIFIFKKIEKMRRAGRSTGDFNYDALQVALTMLAEAEMEVS